MLTAESMGLGRAEALDRSFAWFGWAVQFPYGMDDASLASRREIPVME